MLLRRLGVSASVFVIAVAGLLFCATAPAPVKDAREGQIQEYLRVDPQADELFRVYLSSSRYLVSQMKFLDRVSRGEDPGGDKFICEEMKKHDKIEETRTAVVTVWLFPDTGRLMKIRPKKLSYLMEIDSLIIEDIQRWNFKFEKNYIYPTKFDIMYRVALRKKQSDEEILKEVQEKLKEKSKN